jgi:Leucine-rich repeat (LRR) protein
VQVYGDLTKEELTHLEKLQKLEFLSVGRTVDRLDFRTTHSVPRLTMPYLPRLRELDTTDIDWDGLSNLPALESLWWSGEPVDEATFRQLAALPKLRRLRLTRCVFSAAGLSHLRSQRSLRCLFLSGPIDRDLMREIGQLTQLGELDLTSFKFDPAALSHLGLLTQLETLNLCLTPVDDKTLDHLPPLANLRNLDLSGTKVTSSAIEALARRRQLRNLMLDAKSFTPEERKRLEAALPECQMWYTQVGP